MIIQSRKILSQFSPHISNHIVEFCKQVTKTECDVFIVFARKAACFISMLEDVGLVQLSAPRVSERVLDYDTSWLIGKRVVLIDDTVISGTSIFKTIEMLEKIGVESISVQVFCVNKYWFVDEMLENGSGKSYLKEPYLHLGHTASLKFCKDIVRAFSIHPRPYSTDFPIYESIRLNEADINQLESLKEWKIVGTTSSLQDEYNIRCFSMNPRKEVLQEFFDETGVPIARHSYLKLRIYAEQLTKGNDSRVSYICRILPLVIFEPTSHDLLNKLIDSIINVEQTDGEFIKSQLRTPIAKLRLIQFYFAYRFFNYCMKKFSLSLGRRVKFEVNHRETELLFPPKLVEVIRKFTFEGKMSLNENDLIHKFLPFRSDGYSNDNTINPYEVTDLLMGKFMKLYYDKEMVARRFVKQLKRKAFLSESAKDVINRLTDGYTFGDLKKALNDLVPFDGDQNLILSNFLDSTIDSGIVVPVTLDKNGYTSRGYRHGEEIIWGENNDKLLAIFYRSFMEKAKMSDISKFLLEKSLVLFLKMGLKERMLDEYTSQVAPPQAMRIIAVRSYLFGQVTVQYTLKPSQDTSFHPILDYEIKGNWTTQRLEDLDVLRRDDAGGRYRIDLDKLSRVHQTTLPEESEPTDLDPGLSDKAEEMGELLGLVRNLKRLNSSELVLLTSCLTIHDCIPSIAAEVHIYYQHVEQIENWVKTRNANGSFSVKFLHQLRDHEQNICWTAINSGCDKYLDFKAKKGQQLVQTISEELEKSNGKFTKRAWDKFWLRESAEDSKTFPDLFRLNDEIGLALIGLNISLTYLHMLIYERIKRSGGMEKHIEGKRIEIKSRRSQKEKIQKRIDSFRLIDPHSQQSSIDFDHADKLRELEEESKLLDSIIKKDETDVVYLEDYVTNNRKRIELLAGSYFEQCGTDIPMQRQKVNAITGYYTHFSDTELKEEVDQVMASVMEFRDKASQILVEFSSLVPQWGKLNPIAKYSSLIHLTTNESADTDRNKIKNTVLKVVTAFNASELDSETGKPVVMLRVQSSIPNPGLFIGGKGAFAIDKMTKLSGLIYEECYKTGLEFSIHFFPALESSSVISAYYNKHRNETDEVHYDILSTIGKLEDQKGKSRVLFIYNTIRGKSSASEYKSIINKEIKGGVRYENSIYISRDEKKEDLFIMHMDENKNGLRDILIGIVTALPIEFAAVRAQLDGVDDGFKRPEDDNSDYVKGYILDAKGEKIPVVVALAKQMGNNSAAITTANLIRSYPNVSDIVMCGIAGAVPHPENPKDHVRLGDIVLSGLHGVLQYDNTKDFGDKIEIRSTSTRPSSRLIGAARVMESDAILGITSWISNIDRAIEKYPKFSRPDVTRDVLRIKGINKDHPEDTLRLPGVPRVFTGPIGSSNTLLKNEDKRDYLRDFYNVKAIEMEGSGITDGTWELGKEYFIVRGTVDYCNPDKNDDWHFYAACIAGAYTKSLIQRL